MLGTEESAKAVSETAAETEGGRGGIVIVSLASGVRGGLAAGDASLGCRCGVASVGGDASPIDAAAESALRGADWISTPRVVVIPPAEHP